MRCAELEKTCISFSSHVENMSPGGEKEVGGTVWADGEVTMVQWLCWCPRTTPCNQFTSVLQFKFNVFRMNCLADSDSRRFLHLL